MGSGMNMNMNVNIYYWELSLCSRLSDPQAELELISDSFRIRITNYWILDCSIAAMCHNFESISIADDRKTGHWTRFAPMTKPKTKLTHILRVTIVHELNGHSTWIEFFRYSFFSRFPSYRMAFHFQKKRIFFFKWLMLLSWENLNMISLLMIISLGRYKNTK